MSVACDSTCLTCSNASLNSCLSCKYNASLSAGQCSCKPGYYRGAIIPVCIGEDNPNSYK